MSGYMLFLKDFRSSRPDSDSKVPVGEFAKLAGAAWKELDEQTRAEYQSKAKLLKQEKANVEQDNSAKLLFPLANVKRIAKLDPEVKNISKDALLMIAKATECFVETCAQRTSAIARSNNKKTIELAYLCNFLIFEKRGDLEFLRKAFPKHKIPESRINSSHKSKRKSEDAQADEKKSDSADKKMKRSKRVSGPPEGTKSLFNFFQRQPKSLDEAESATIEPHVEGEIDLSMASEKEEDILAQSTEEDEIAEFSVRKKSKLSKKRIIDDDADSEEDNKVDLDLGESEEENENEEEEARHNHDDEEREEIEEFDN